MTNELKIALAQLNPTVGDVNGNRDLIAQARLKAKEQGADLMVASELVLSGYPPEDLVIRPSFQEACMEAVELLAEQTSDGGPGLLLGTIWVKEGKVYNAAVLLDSGRVVAVRFKHELPNYGVFDEKRVFDPGPLPGPVNFRDVRLGVMICEDMWWEEVSECLEESGAEILVVLNGSPYSLDKWDQRMHLAVERVTETCLPMIYVNQIGGQDELVFDGGSFILNNDRSLCWRFADWRPDLKITNWARNANTWICNRGEITAPEGSLSSIYSAMMLGLKDYVEKNQFPGVLLGMSGGIDSALTAAVAVDALGADRVHCVMMPSPYTSKDSLEDASEAVKLLGCQLDEVNIGPAMQAFEKMLTPLFGNAPPDTTEENIQARARGLTLMGLSNKTGAMVVSTGNKSEMSVGYATLYGDMCGGFSVLKDVYKMTVFKLCRWRNENFPLGSSGPNGPVMPERIITKPPSAELKPDQKDEDTLPPYEELDEILECLIEKDFGLKKTADQGFDASLVRRIWQMLLIAEYKRRQAPPGVKITHRSFGRDRRYPITDGFRES
jgi:NAD+ synthase